MLFLATPVLGGTPPPTKSERADTFRVDAGTLRYPRVPVWIHCGCA